MNPTTENRHATAWIAIAFGLLVVVAACGDVAPADATVDVTVHAPFLDEGPAMASTVAPLAVPAGVQRVNVTAFRLGSAVATATLTSGASEAAMALAPGATYDFEASVVGYVPSGVEIAWGTVTSVVSEGDRITLQARSIVHEATLGDTRYEGVDLVVPLDVWAPNGERVPPTDYEVAYAATGASVEEATRLGARLRPDGSGGPVEVTATVTGMNAAYERGTTFVAVQTMTPNDPEVGFDFVVPTVSLHTLSHMLVNQPVVVSGSAQDDVGLVRVELWVNVTRIGEATFPSPEASQAWSFPWVPSVEGDHTLTVLAYDASGNVGRADAPITVWFAPPAAAGEPYAWMTTFPELKIDHEPAGLAVDGAGDLYQVFTHRALPAHAHDFNVGVVSKHRPDGATHWVRQYEGQFHMHFTAAAGTADGVVIAGSTPGTIPGATESGAGEAFLMGLTASGEPLWVTRFAPDPSYGVNAHVWATDAVTAANGDILIVGEVTGVSVDGDAYVARFSSTGEQLWATTIGVGNRWDGGTAIALAPEGGAYVAGFTTSAFEGFTNTSGVYGYEDVFVAHVTEDGDVAWVTQFGSGNKDWVQALATAPSGGVYGVAITLGTFPDATRTSSPGSGEGAAFHVDADGSLVWLTQFATNVNTSPRDLAIDPTGDLHVVGSTRGAFPGQVSAGNLDVFHARLTPAGAMASAVQFGSSKHDQAWHAVWHAGGLYAMGDHYYDSTANDRLSARRFLARVEP